MEWAGKSRSKDAWKAILVSGHAIASGEPGEVIEGLEGELVAVRESTARMSTRRVASLIEYAQSVAVELGVHLSDPEMESLDNASYG